MNALNSANFFLVRPSNGCRLGVVRATASQVVERFGIQFSSPLGIHSPTPSVDGGSMASNRVHDERHGFGVELLRRMVQIGRDEKLKRIVATILAENVAMQRVPRKVGFALKRVESEYQAELDLSAS